jgi:hypothetical protein
VSQTQAAVNYELRMELIALRYRVSMLELSVKYIVAALVLLALPVAWLLVGH